MFSSNERTKDRPLRLKGFIQSSHGRTITSPGLHKVSTTKTSRNNG